MFKHTWIITLSLFLLANYTRPVFAVNIPSFPSCAAPQGSIMVSYSSGTHGIVGSSATYTGSDTVYRVSDDAVTQCFCPDSGNGIQTDWWKAISLSETEINVLKSQSWFYVPSGVVWGLDQSPYVARNTAFSCLPGSPTQVLDDSTGTGGGEVLGLAATGDSWLVYGTFAAGLVCLIWGIRRLRHA